MGLVVLLFISPELFSQLLINEFVASNVTGGYYDPTYQEYPDWVEIRNTSESSIDLGGYFLTDDLSDLNKWEIPEGTVIDGQGYFLFIADGRDENNRTNFKLSADGETLGISNPEKVLLDSLVYLPQSSNVSMGRLVAEPNLWAYFPVPTPNAENNTAAFSGKTMAPVLGSPAGFYDQALALDISSRSPSAVIRYTLDGSTPEVSSLSYTGPLQVSTNTILKAICFEEGLMPSDVVTATYFIGESTNLPVVSFSMSPGLASSFPSTSERKVHMEYFDKAGNQVLNQDVGSRITGLVGIHPMRSFSLYARSTYGENRMNHRLFFDKTLTNYKNVVLRNGGYQDYSYTYLRDGLIQSFAIDNLDLDYQSYQPVLVFRNGSFLSLLNMREKLNEFYIENNHGVDKDSIDFLEYQTEPPIDVLMGDSEHFDNMMAFIETADLTQQANMDFLETQMDVKNYLDYYMLQIYCANADWPDKNSKIWRPRQAGGRWRWMVFDVDYGYGFAFPVEKNMYEYLYDLEEPYYHNRPWVTVIFKKIMENERMRNYYLQRFSVLLNTVFSEDRALSLIDSLKAAIDPEMARHIAMWGSKPYGIPSMAEWQNNCEVLYDFARRRPHFARKNMMDFYHLEDTVSVLVKSRGGIVKINDFPFSSDSVTGQFFSGIPLDLEAIPDNGYEFVEWIHVSDKGQPSNSMVANSDTTIEAVFRPVSNNLLDGTFTEDVVLADVSEPYIARGHLLIPANVQVTLEAGVQLLMPESCHIYVYGTLIISGTEDNPVLIDAFTESWGGICLDHTTGISDFTHLILKGASTGGDPEIYPGAISAYHSDLNLKAVVIEDVPANPLFTQYGNIRVDSCRFQSDGTCDLINIKHADVAIVENSILMDSKMADTDAIDFDNVTSGIIRNNKIYNLIGENSDGIDIGEGTRNVQIYGNLIVNCRDKGISLGQASSMSVYRNVIYNCNMGIAVKDVGSSALVYNNTLVGNSLGIASYEKNLGSGAGSVTVVNTILADTEISSIIEKNNGEVVVDYSLSNTDILPGVGNVFGDPHLANVSMLNFELLPNSPCLDSGSPDYPLDSDGSLADMGAYYLANWPEIHRDLIINEYYSNTSSEDPEDWIEIYNKGNSGIDLSNWYIMDGGNDYYRLPPGSFVDRNSFVVVCKDTSNFKEFFGADRTLYGDFDFSLSGSRDLISLFDSDYTPVKSLSYDEDESWPDSRDKRSLSVALIDTSLLITEARSWRTGYKMYGTPGYSNIPPRIKGLYLNEISGQEQSTYPDNFGEYEDWIEIYNASGQDINFGALYFTDDLDNLTKSQIRQNSPDSTYISANGYKVLFADGEVDQGILHLDFRISASGEELGLVQLVGLDTVTLDRLVFGAFSPGASLGRRMDGGIPWEAQEFTPGGTNTSLDLEIQEEIFANVYPNPARDMLYIAFPAAFEGTVGVQVLNALGQLMLSEISRVYVPGEQISMDVSTLKAGVYFLKLRSGRLSSVKRIVVAR